MYENGEIEELMGMFEKAVKQMPTYVGGSMERADRVEIEKEEGRISKRYLYNNYYSNGNVNQLFIAYLWGYSYGKAV